MSRAEMVDTWSTSLMSGTTAHEPTGFDMNFPAAPYFGKEQGSHALESYLAAWVANTSASSTTGPLLLTQHNSTRAIALESATWCREPFVPTTPTSLSLGSDHYTRISLFAMNIGPAFGDSSASSIKANAEDSAHNRYPLLVEYAGNVPGYPWLQMLIVRLNENMGRVGDVLVSIHAHGKTSNRVRVGIGFVGGGLPDDSTPMPAPSGSPAASPTPVSPEIPTIIGFELHDANNSVFPLSNGTTLVMGNYQEPLVIYALPGVSPINNVHIVLGTFDDHVENAAPYTTQPFTLAQLGVGTHQLSATPFTVGTAPATQGTPFTISIEVVDPTPTPTPTAAPTPTPTPAQNPRECDYYVSTSGSSGNSGAIGSSWSLAYAFSGAGGKITAGKTVCLRAGTYLNTSGWSIDPSLDGTSSSPIIFRNYAGERATLDTGSGSTNPVLVLNADYNWIIGLEIMNSNTSPGQLDSGDGISHGTATGNKVIDCIIHDNTGNGIGAFSSLTDFEAYGNVLYYNGKTPNNGNNNAYNIYTQNTGPLGKTFRSNALFHCFGNYPAHMYGSRNMDNLHWSNNAGTNYHNGKWWLVDSGVRAQNFVFQNNYLYSQDRLPGIFDLGAHGFGAGTNGASVTGNYFGWGTIAMNILNSGTIFTNNTIYYGDLFQFASSSCPTCTNFTGNSFTTSRPGTNWGPFVTPNRYEPGRAMLVVYNWQNLDNVAVDFSSFLNVGDRYEIRDAQNYYGALIGSGTYPGGTVNISTTSTAPATPTAVPSNRSTPTHTTKEYQVWVVIRTSPY